MEEQLGTTGKSLQKQKSFTTDLLDNPSSNLAFESKSLVTQVLPFMNLPSENDKQLFIMALKRFQVTEKELNDSFWLAYADPYVPNTGVEFRHLWKYIQPERDHDDKSLLTYNEMLEKIFSKDNPAESTNDFEPIYQENSKPLWRFIV